MANENIDWGTMDIYSDNSWQNDFNTPQTFQMPTMNQNVGANLVPNNAGYQPAPNYEAFSPSTSDSMSGYNEQQPGWIDRFGSSMRNLNFDPSSKVGMDNIFRAGQGGVGLLDTFLRVQENRKAQKAQENALAYMQSQMGNPFEERLTGMIDNPSGYLNDPVDSAMTARAEEGALRARTKAGRSGLGYEDQLNLQGLRQKSYQNRLQTLAQLYSQARAGNQAAASTIAQIMRAAPPGNANAITGGLGAVFGAGRDIAASSGVASNLQPTRNTNYDLLS